jgi:hypothetical protein
VAHGALARCESRGGHARADYPDTAAHAAPTRLTLDAVPRRSLPPAPSRSRRMIPRLPHYLIQDLVKRALEEDLGGRGDVTALATIPADRNASFVIASRAEGVLSGQQPAHACFDLVDRDIAVTWRKQDGDALTPGDIVAVVDGPALRRS